MLIRRLPRGGTGGFTPVSNPTTYAIVAAPGGGGWTEVLGPHAAYASGKTYIGWVGGNSKPGDIEIASWNGSTLSAATLLHDNLTSPDGDPDSHIAPAVLVLPDGKILTAYMSHNVGTFYSRRSTSAGSIAAFDGEVSQAIADGNTYAQLSYMSSIDRVYCTYRVISGSNSYQGRSHSDDHGDTWHATTRFYSSGHANHYSAFASDGVRWIHFAVTDNDPIPNFGLWYFKMDASTGDLYAANGTLLTSTLPAPTSALTQLVASGDQYPYSVSFTGDGRPVIAWQTKGSNPVRFGEFRWSGSAWIESQIGTSDPISPSILSVGGGLHVWGDSGRFITSRMDSGSLIVSEYRSSDDGATWSHFDDYGSGSSPVYVRDGVDIVAVWFAPASSFVNSHDFDPGLTGVS